MKIKIKKLSDNVKIPKKSTKGSAGFDVFLPGAIGWIYPNEVRKIGLGFALEMPEGWECQIRQRSGMSGLYPGYLSNSVGTIDSDYRDEVAILFWNNSDKKIRFDSGTKIAQLVFKEVPEVKLSLVKELSDTNRKGGFGSTGDK